MTIKALARRTAVVLALTLPAAGLVIAAGLPQASACSNTSHCYATAYNQHVAANHGVFGELYVTCLYQPDNGNRVTNEVWDVSKASSYWVEAGITSGLDYHGVYRNKDWVWADSQPGSPYMEHDTSVEANVTTKYPVQISFAGTDTWDVFGENNFTEFGTSTGNSFTPVTAEGGTEYTSSATSGLRDIGNIFTLENQGLNSNWYLLGGAATISDSGPGFFIFGSYNVSTSEQSWSGPC